jgi:hypothetical protein
MFSAGISVLAGRMGTLIHQVRRVGQGIPVINMLPAPGERQLSESAVGLVRGWTISLVQVSPHQAATTGRRSLIVGGWLVPGKSAFRRLADVGGARPQHERGTRYTVKWCVDSTRAQHVHPDIPALQFVVPRACE